jgi:CRISPR-associated protein Cas1
MPDVYVGAKGETLVVRSSEAKEIQIPILNLESVVVFGYRGVSPEAMALCVENGTSLVFLTPNGQFKARITGETKGNVLLRRTQYRWSDSESESLRLAQRFVIAKMSNARTSFMRSLRDHGDRLDRARLEAVCKELAGGAVRSDRCRTLDELRGLEGLAARQYFSVLSEQVLVNKEYFHLRGRVKRPPTDRLNALLSFLYSLLASDVTHALESVGLDPQIGFLHRDRPGRNSLALDLMEELRVFIADRMALSLINRQQLGPGDFVQKESGAYFLKDEALKIVLTEWQQRKREELRHPYLGEKIAIGLLPYAQALLLARHMRGDLDDYPPFVMR